MPLSLVAVGAKITASFINSIVVLVNRQGLTSVIPTSVGGTGVTLATTGKVTFSAATSINVNGCFGAEFEDYLVVIKGTRSTSLNLALVLRAAGTDSTASNYDLQSLVASGGTPSSALNAAQASWAGFLASAASPFRGKLDFFGPALATQTGLITLMGANDISAGTGAIVHTTSGHRLATAYDGFTITPSAGNITGTLRIYGYNNN